MKQSFLKDYPIEVRHNTIDTNVFRPIQSDFRDKYNLEHKKIILGVASAWGENKGLGDFIKLSSMLDKRYVIILVGLNKNQIKKMPNAITLEELQKETNESKIDLEKSRIICIAKTNDAVELAEIYTAADVFVNLTYQDNYPTVNLEAQACGTPCITYRTGGSVESVPVENIVEQGDLYGIVKRVTALVNEKSEMSGDM